MTAELVRGQNHPLTEARPEVRVSAGRPVTVGAFLADGEGRLVGTEGVLLPGGAAGPPGVGLPGPADGGEHRVTVDLAALPETVHRVGVVLALPAGQRFGGGPAPFTAVVAHGAPGPPLVSYTITGLDSESAVVALELYRRQGAWKVRAVGQGYAAGLEALLADHGLTPAEARRLAAAASDGDRFPASPAAPAGGTAVTGAAAASGALTAPRPAAPDGAGTPAAVPAGPGAAPVSGVGAVAPGPPADGSGAPAVVSAGPVAPGAGTAGGGIGHRHRDRAAGAAGSASGGSGHADPGVPAGTSSGGASVPPPGAPAGQPVDYRHPRRREAPPAGPAEAAAPVAGDAAGWSMEERLYNQVWGMFEDLARAVAAHRGAVEFADGRMDQELDGVLGDYRARADGTVDRARREARARREELVARAQQVLDQQLAQLRAESEVVEPALPPAYARWESPVWSAYRAPGEQPLAVRLGDLSLPESGALRIPLLLRLPLERGLWIDGGRGRSADSLLVTPEERRRLALDMAVALATRLLAAHPPGDFTVEVIDAAGAGARSLAPLSRGGVLTGPPAVGPGAVSGLLARLAGHVDLVQMAVRAGAPESLPPGTDLSQRLLIVHDFPHAFDDRAVTALRYLADEGPRAGVHLLLVADREDAAGFGALLDPLWRSLLRLTPVPEDHLADPWVCHAWTYEPSLPPRDGGTVEGVLDRVAAARRR
ncbi:TerD family protein [Streptomyces sp. MJP52]|uniref:TerD family protein n=1 Tax=Streptomyces sp. MJP52 TaxID=2940555 RepID=UPI0024750927|nr:TerD family protein [Streptomyces sp. MJP52]